MPPLSLRIVLLLALLLPPALARPASALTIDPATSSVAAEFGGVESLAGTVDVSIGLLPLTGTTTFDVTGLAVTSSGSLAVDLDPASPAPGAGVVNASGGFLVPNLFLAVDVGGGAFPLAVPGVAGTIEFDASGLRITRLQTSFEVDSGGPDGVLTFTVVAVPEPGAALGALALLALAARRRGVVR